MSNITYTDCVRITLEVPSVNQTIDHYIIKVDENPPMLVKNTSFLLPISQDQQTIHLRAVDGCGQKGDLEMLSFPSAATTTDTHTTVYPSSTAPTNDVDPLVKTVAETGESDVPSGAIAITHFGQADMRSQLIAMGLNFLFLTYVT